MPQRILVVDDEPAADLLMRQIFRKEIRRSEYELVFAEDGEEALRKLQAIDGIGVVMTDINMPGMDGMTLLSHITELYPKIKVFVVSAYNDREKVERARSYGAYDFINKPIQVRAVKEIIQKALAC